MCPGLSTKCGPQVPFNSRALTPHSTARNVELNEARLRMAALPSPADEVLFTPGLWVPLVVVDRVYILPGIPRLFQSMVSAQQVRGRGGARAGCCEAGLRALPPWEWVARMWPRSMQPVSTLSDQLHALGLCMQRHVAPAAC